MMQAADDGPFVHNPRAHREQIADLDAGNFGGDRAEFAAVLDRRFRFRIPRLVLAGAAPHPEDDNGIFPRSRFAVSRGSRFTFEQVRQRQARQTKQAHFQKAAPFHCQQLAELGATNLIRIQFSHCDPEWVASFKTNRIWNS
jgi:hypothetical protein